MHHANCAFFKKEIYPPLGEKKTKQAKWFSMIEEGKKEQIQYANFNPQDSQFPEFMDTLQFISSPWTATSS